AKPAKAYVVVTHGGVIRALLGEVLGLPLIDVFRFQIDFASVTQLLLEEKVKRIGYVNR
ncbi:MAG: histidine phosphatase family protein, partial [Methylophilaceae bacterium]